MIREWHNMVSKSECGRTDARFAFTLACPFASKYNFLAAYLNFFLNLRCNRPEWAKENSRWYNDDGFHRLDKKYIYRGKPPPEEEEERWRRSLADNEIREK